MEKVLRAVVLKKAKDKCSRQRTYIGEYLCYSYGGCAEFLKKNKVCGKFYNKQINKIVKNIFNFQLHM